MSKRRTLEEIKKMSIEVHGEFYDFSKFHYVNNKTPSIIICPIHGEFLQKINNHISLKQGCPECKKDTLKAYNTKPFEGFKEELLKVHGERFIVKEEDYKGYSMKMKVECREHGEFYISPYRLINNKYGCKKCSNELQETRLNTTEDFVNKSLELHGDTYDYSKVVYNGNRSPVTITCKVHGDFQQVPMNHLTGSGCSKCNIKHSSKTEKEVRSFIEKYVICEPSNRSLLNGKEVDIIIPSKNLAIEYDGIYWHSDKFLDKNYHLNKTNQCEEKGFQLVHIFEDEWLEKKSIVKSRLLNLLGLSSTKIFARQCEVRIIDYETCSLFLDSNHIQGNSMSTYRFGLFYKGELVSVMTFGGLRKSLGLRSKVGSYELLRFCNKINTNVVGGASKLLKFFERNYSPKEVVSYADRRWSSGQLYLTLGFEFIHNTPANYFYVKEGTCKRENRFKYRKDVLVKDGFDKSKTERQIMIDRGFTRIYDCGNKKYIKKYITN